MNFNSTTDVLPWICIIWIFADDLMLFSREDVQSTALLKRALKVFADTSGPESSQTKATIYFGNAPLEN